MLYYLEVALWASVLQHNNQLPAAAGETSTDFERRMTTQTDANGNELEYKLETSASKKADIIKLSSFLSFCYELE